MKENISHEVRKGARQLWTVVGSRRAQDQKVEVVEASSIELEKSINGPSLGLSSRGVHTLSSILPIMEEACSELEMDLREAEDEAKSTLESLQYLVDDLSDLRYESLPEISGFETNVRDKVVESLHGLEPVLHSLRHQNQPAATP